MVYIGKTLTTESKEFIIKRETKYCVYVSSDNCQKDIAIGKMKLRKNDNGFYVEFENVITHTDWQLNELGFKNSKIRKQLKYGK